MTQLNPGFRSLFCLAAVLALLPHHANAGPALEAAQAGRAQAFNDFYQQYLHSKRKTPEAIAEIRRRTLTPAGENLSRALAEETVESVKRAGASYATEADLVQAKKREKQLASDKSSDTFGSGEKVGRSSGKSGSKSGGKDAPPSSLSFDGKNAGSAEKATETKIDGSKIPSHIQFQKKKPKDDDD